MIAGFKEKFADGTPTYFREKILIGVDHPEARAYYFGGKGMQVLPLGDKGHRKFTVWDGTNDGFVKVNDLVVNPKITTIRQGNRWKDGMSIQMATGVRTKNYQQFNKGIPELSTVKIVLPIKIEWFTFHMKDLPILTGKPSRTPNSEDFLHHREPVVIIDGYRFPSGCTQVKQLAKNDGFDNLEQFYKFFNKDFEGQLISWMDIKPNPMDWVHEILKYE